MKKVEVEKVLTAAAIKKVVADDMTSKSAKMKALFDGGMELKAIAVELDVRYNFVYNVVSNYVNMNGIAVESNKKAGKKEAIVELHKAGKSNKEISVELQTNYNYVFNVVKAYKATQVEVAGGAEA